MSIQGTGIEYHIDCLEHKLMKCILSILTKICSKIGNFVQGSKGIK